MQCGKYKLTPKSFMHIYFATTFVQIAIYVMSGLHRPSINTLISSNNNVTAST